MNVGIEDWSMACEFSSNVKSDRPSRVWFIVLSIGAPSTVVV